MSISVHASHSAMPITTNGYESPITTNGKSNGNTTHKTGESGIIFTNGSSTSGIIFTNGELDPWATGGISGAKLPTDAAQRDLVAITMRGAQCAFTSRP